MCPLDQILVHGECIEATVTSEGVVYHANLLIVFEKVIKNKYRTFLYDSIVDIKFRLEEFCKICSTTLYELNYRPTTTLVYRVEIGTGKRCGEDVILRELKIIESLRFSILRIDASYTASVIDLITSEPGPIMGTMEPPECQRESMEKYITISSHYFCKAVLVDRERALLISSKNVTYKDVLLPLTYVCEDDMMLFTDALGTNGANDYMPCYACVYLYLLTVILCALFTVTNDKF